MAILDKLTLGTTVTFDTYPAAIIGTTFEDVKILGFFDKGTANAYIDADSMHANVFPTLPNGTPNDPDDYTFVKVQHPNGNFSVIGIPWIIESSIVIINKGKLTLVLDNITIEDRERIVSAIAANGYKISKINLE